jgi:hypothetical protein
MFNLSALADFVSKTLDDTGLRKALQPAGLFAATVFIVLNVVLIYPLALRQRIGPAQFFSELNTASQVALLGVLVLFLSDLVISLSPVAQRIFTGELMEDSRLLVGIARNRRHKASQLRDTNAGDPCTPELGGATTDWLRRIETLSSQVLGTKPMALVYAPNPAASHDSVAISHRIAAGRRHLGTLERHIKKEPNLSPKDRKQYSCDLAALSLEADEMITQWVRCRQRQWEKTLEYPAEEGYAAATRFGNVLAAVASNIWRRYRIDLTVLWPYMENLLPEKNKSLSDRIAGDQATIDFLLNTALVLIIFWLESLLFFAWAQLDALVGLAPGELYVRFTLSLLTITALTAAAVAVCYWAATRKAVSWGRSVAMAFELHGVELRQKLGLREPRGRADGRLLWQTASQWLAWGPQNAAAGQTLDATSAQVLSVDKAFQNGVVQEQPRATGAVGHHSQSVAVSLSAPLIRLKSGIPPIGSSRYIQVQEIVDYLIIVNDAGRGNGKDGPRHASILIVDPRIPSIDAPPKSISVYPNNVTVQCAIVLAEGQHAHDLWLQLDAVPQNGSATLQYRLPGRVMDGAWLESAGTATFAEAVLDPPSFRFTIATGSNPGANCVLRVASQAVSANQNVVALVSMGDDPAKLSSSTTNEGVAWRLSKLPPNTTVILTYDIHEAENVPSTVS